MFFSSDGWGIDLSGMRPPAPYGVFSTMSANTPGRGNAAVAFSVEKAGGPDYYRLSTHLAHGITDNIEIDAGIPFVGDSVSGLEDISFGLKHMFYDGGGRYGPSMAYVLTVSVSSGSKEALGTDGRVGAGLLLSRRLGPFYGHANAFYAVPNRSGLEDEILLLAGIEFSSTHSLTLLGEFMGRKSHFSQDKFDQLEMRLGYRFLAGGNLYTTLGAGFGLKERTPDYRLMAALSILFPRDEGPQTLSGRE